SVKRTRFLNGCLLLCALFGPSAVPGQTLLAESATTEAARLPPTQNAPPKLSPAAEEMAKVLGIMPLIERLSRLPESDRTLGSTASLEALTLRQEITEVVLGASLEVDGLMAEIDNELAQISAVRA